MAALSGMGGAGFLGAPTNLAELLAVRGAATPERIALRFECDTLSYRELDERASRVAAGLSSLGVRRGQPVCVLFDTSCDYVVTWLALTRIGALEVPINTGFRGPLLAHALNLTSAEMLLVDSALAPLVAEVGDRIPHLKHVILRGDAAAATLFRGLRVTPFDELLTACADEVRPVSSESGETAMLLFTSGSTGPSKACRIPHRYVLRQPQIFCEQLGVGPDDVLYAPFPLFHADGAIFTVAAALASGGTAALAPRFSVSKFWSDCRRHGATLFDYMGATLTMLYKQPPSPSDADNPVRLGWGVPAPLWAEEFERRFDLELVEVYGLSDAGIVLYNRPGEPRRAGSCGRAVPPFDVRVHDRFGLEAPNGEAGELVIRADEPHVIMTDYYGNPAATVEAFRDLWFHTGDLVRRDEDGFFYFVGRLKDVIRRRGENISAFDLEQALLDHPDIVEAAAYGVPSELTEDEVMVTVVPRPGTALAAQDVVDWAASRLSRHMVPRYVRLVDAIPRTETEKPAKYRLKELGVTPDTIDFETPRPSRGAEPQAV